VPRVIISPFTDLNVVFRLRAKRASGEITSVTVGEIVEAAYADPQALEKPALLDPALSLARQHPGEGYQAVQRTAIEQIPPGPLR